MLDHRLHPLGSTDEVGNVQGLEIAGEDSTGLPGAATAAPMNAQEEELALSIGYFQQRLRKDKVEEMRCVSFAVLPANVTQQQVTFLLILLWLAGA